MRIEAIKIGHNPPADVNVISEAILEPLQRHRRQGLGGRGHDLLAHLGAPGENQAIDARFHQGSPGRAVARDDLDESFGEARFGAELRDQLERLQALMRSSVPDGDLGKIIKVAVAEKLERLEAKRFGKTKTACISSSNYRVSCRTLSKSHSRRAC